MAFGVEALAHGFSFVLRVNAEMLTRKKLFVSIATWSDPIGYFS